MNTSEEDFRLLVEAMPQIVWITRPDGWNIYFNQQWMDYTGLTLKESLGHGWNKPFHPDDQQRAWAAWQNATATRCTYSLECRLRRADGVYRWWLIRGVPHLDDSGQIFRWYGTCTDIDDLKMAERELLEKTAFLEAQVNSSIDGILVVDEHGKKILQNRRVAELGNMPQHIQDDPDDEKQVRWFVSFIKNPEPFLAKVAYLYAHPNEISRDEIELKNGAVLDRYSAPVLGKDGKYYGRIWTFRDITEQRRREQELKEAKIAAVLREGAQRYNFLADTVPLIIWTARPDGGLDYYNKTWFDYTGLTLAQTQDWGWGAVLHPDDLPRCVARWTRSFTTGEGYEIEYRFKRAADGTYRWFLGRASARRNEAGEIVQWVGTCTDIDDQKRAEDELRRARSKLEGMVAERTSELQHANQALQAEAAQQERTESQLRESNEKFLQLADNISDVFWVTSPDGQTLLYVSPAHEKIWGRSVESLYAHPLEWTDAILPEDSARVRAAFARLASDAPSVSVEFRIARPDGAVRWILSRGFQARDAAGTLVRLLGIATDITERKRFEAQLLQSQKFETVGRLAGGIAHEFNSILTAIIGQGELLLGDLPAGSPLRKNANEIRQAAERAATLARQLLAYGRKQILLPAILDLNSVLARMEGPLRHLLGRGVDVRLVPAPELKAVKVDVGQIEQVIMNLAMNAADAMPKGGKLTLETANLTLDAEYVGNFSELKAGEYVMLAVTDTGCGMSEEVKARVFEPFFTTKGVGEGTGLGLSTCYGIIKQSGGHISVYSELDLGTTFKIYLPQADASAQIPLQRLDAPDLPRGTETILLVEDDPALRDMAAAWLRRLGYTVLAAADGVEALNLKQQRKTGSVDLLFTDVVMPHMSGKELSERVRALNPQIRVLFTSAYTQNAIAHQGVLKQGAALLQKPFTPGALANKIREVLDQPGDPKPPQSKTPIG